MLSENHEVSFAAGGRVHAVIRTLVIERVVKVGARAFGDEVVGSEPSAGAQVAIGNLGIHLELVRDLE